ncbi:MAG: LUD domain-containing protein, partial [Pseudomonadota bacterium]
MPQHYSFIEERTLQSNTHDLQKHAHKALHEPNLQQALTKLSYGFIEKRKKAANGFSSFEACRDHARDIKNHCLQHLDLYLEKYEQQVTKSGGHVHWARNDAEALNIILDLCKKQNAKLITKGKSMISEEIGLNNALEQANFKVVETDLGEYIIQLRKEHPSHIIAPAVHVLKTQVEDTFRQHHQLLPKSRNLDQRVDLVREARQILRSAFLNADIGITGANFLIAENGASIIVTNEGNGDLTQTLAKTH